MSTMRTCGPNVAGNVLLSGRSFKVTNKVVDLTPSHSQFQAPIVSGRTRLRFVFPILVGGLIVSLFIGLYIGYQPIDFHTLQTDPIAHAVLFRLRLPRVIMAS